MTSTVSQMLYIVITDILHNGLVWSSVSITTLQALSVFHSLGSAAQMAYDMTNRTS